MNKAYETPAVADLGRFQDETGEFIGPHTEAILPCEDHPKVCHCTGGGDPALSWAGAPVRDPIPSRTELL